MNTFPTILTGSGFVFRDDKDPDTVQVASTASGYPILNKLFTFDGRIFSFDWYFVSQADKETIMTFYENNKDVPFFWNNEQDDVKYEVVFTQPPRYRVDGQKDRWKIRLELMQSSPNWKGSTTSTTTTSTTTTSTTSTTSSTSTTTTSTTSTTSSTSTTTTAPGEELKYWLNGEPLLPSNKPGIKALKYWLNGESYVVM